MWVASLLTVAAYLPTQASAHTPALPQAEYVIIGAEAVTLNAGVTVAGGHVGVDSDPSGHGRLTLGRKVAFTDATSHVVADTAVINQGTHVPNVAYNTLTNHGTTGTEVSPLPLPWYGARPEPLQHEFQHGSSVDVLAGTQEHLTPERYGALTVGQGAAVALAPGWYEFPSIDIGKEATLQTSGATTVLVESDFRAQRYASIGNPTSGPVELYVEASPNAAVTFGAQVEARLHLRAVGSEVDIGRQAVVTGAVHASTVVVDQGAHVGWAGLTRATPRSLDFTSPDHGDPVFAIETLTVSVEPANAEGPVLFAVDGVLLGTAEVVNGVAAFSWDTSVRADGPHVATARIVDAAGGVDVETAVEVTITNEADAEERLTLDLAGQGGWLHPGWGSGDTSCCHPQRQEDHRDPHRYCASTAPGGGNSCHQDRERLSGGP